MFSPKPLVLVSHPFDETEIEDTHDETHFRHSEFTKVVEPSPKFIRQYFSEYSGVYCTTNSGV